MMETLTIPQLLLTILVGASIIIGITVVGFLLFMRWSRKDRPNS